ncbi:MAG: DUF4258 domain-containing protein [Chloroflexi bacterium]|nr:DUF4258 domain-containing protein [Chloroflexota bacterium]
MEVTFSAHALVQMERRGISREEAVATLMDAGEEFTSLLEGLEEEAYLSLPLPIQKVHFDSIESKQMLLRVFVRLRQDGFHVLTAYKTSRIGRYLPPETQP